MMKLLMKNDHQLFLSLKNIKKEVEKMGEWEKEREMEGEILR